MKKLLYFIFILCLVIIPSISKAEVEIGIVDSDISVDIFPEVPEPYEDTKVSLTSYATDLNKAMIEWRSGGKIILSGYGKTSYSFKTQGPDTSTSFEITIVVAGTGDRITKQFTINPSEVEVLWESVDGYTPLFYKGKSFPSQEGVIKVVAISNTNKIKSGRGDITYTWKKSDKTMLSSSGYNKDTFVFVNSMLNDAEKISVTASSIDGNYNANKELEIPIYSPKVLFYKRSPTEGILYNEALSSDSIFKENEMTIVAEPYFLAIRGNENRFNYNWTINGDAINTPSKKTELTVTPTSRGGYANIGLVFESMDKLFQKAVGELKLTL